jgi:L-lactate dehydrogenase complex protein LldG
MSSTPLAGLFENRVLEYGARVTRCSPSGLPRALAEALENRGVRSLAVPADLPSAWLQGIEPHVLEVFSDPNPAPNGPSGQEEHGSRSGGQNGSSEALSKERLDSVQGVLTGCALGIAETGTIVLDGGVAQGRRVLTLLPDYHLCVVFTNQLVEDVPQALMGLRDAVRRRRAPITFISGPSATSDIELSRVEGVHGPRTLEVILVEES